MWLVLVACIANIGLRLWTRQRDRQRHAPLAGRLGRTWDSRLAQPLPDNASIIARFGEGAQPRQSLDDILMHTTPGLRILSLTLTAAFLWFIWLGGGDKFLPGAVMDMGSQQMLQKAPSYVIWLFTVPALIACFGIFRYEARVNRHSLIVHKWGLVRRELLWKNLLTIKDNQHYEYVLTFAPGGTVRMPKYLVGMPGFLKVVGEVLEGNDPRHAGTARG
jgi:hypothetical protein